MIDIKEDLTGKEFGRWKVISRIEDYINKSGRAYDMWLCECSCEKHTRKTIYGCNLRGLKSTSCGCKSKETLHKKGLTHNTYEKKEDYYIGYTKKKQPFYFDIEDYNLVSQYCWYIGRDGYVVAHNPKAKIDINEKQFIRMHLLVLNYNGNKEIDHKDSNRANNRKENLREATRAENARNTQPHKDSMYSQYKGVCWHKNAQKWTAYITVNGKRKHLGLFGTELEAHFAYEKAAEKYFGKFKFNNYKGVVLDVL